MEIVHLRLQAVHEDLSSTISPGWPSNGPVIVNKLCGHMRLDSVLTACLISSWMFMETMLDLLTAKHLVVTLGPFGIGICALVANPMTIS